VIPQNGGSHGILLSSRGFWDGRDLIKAAGGAGGEEEACATCVADHDCEASLLEDLGRQLTDIRASIRYASSATHAFTVDLQWAHGFACTVMESHTILHY
jgi:hypothetical protein